MRGSVVPTAVLCPTAQIKSTTVLINAVKEQMILLLAPSMTETIYNSISLDIEQVGFELTCGAVLMRARFAHDSKLLLIYKMHF
jgi:hypothetical protein